MVDQKNGLAQLNAEVMFHNKSLGVSNWTGTSFNDCSTDRNVIRLATIRPESSIHHSIKNTLGDLRSIRKPQGQKHM